jgi:predicted DNA-binding transcriptional regulator AlpA
MTQDMTRTGGGVLEGAAALGERAALLDVRAVAALLACSVRNVYRLSDAGRMPLPVRLGGLVRWRGGALAEWIEAGCPDCRAERGARR